MDRHDDGLRHSFAMQFHHATSTTLSRRRFLSSLAVGLPLLGLAPDVLASSLEAASSTPAAALATRALDFAHTRTGDVHTIDAGLLDLLRSLTQLTGTSKPFQVISGYRSPKPNDMLRQHSEGVAAGSLHMQGQAIDIRLADVPLATLRNAALNVRRGGVGYDPASDFVHVDTGSIRRW